MASHRFTLALAAAVTIAVTAAGCSRTGPRATADPTPSAPPASSAPAADAGAVDYGDEANWLCRPGKSQSPCDVNLDATVIRADGSTSLEAFVPARDPRIDCFYVYPTVSTDPGLNSDLRLGDAERAVVVSQAARFGSVCRLFAPMYRQVTLTALLGGRFADGGAQATAYGDVLAAWRRYLAQDNDGRGVVLIGHSQGAGHLARLVREEIDRDSRQRSLLVSALLIGYPVRVPAGADRGGDFQNVPACRSLDQTGCVLGYSTFSAASPPPASSLFGRGDALCVNPAAPAGGVAGLHSYFGSASNPNARGALTPFVRFEGMVSAECVKEGGFSYLRVTAAEGYQLPAFLRGPEWGLHVYDMSLTLGDLIALVGRQAAAYLSR